MAAIGSYALGLTLIVSLYTLIAAILGTRRRSSALLQSARNGVWVTAATTTAAVGLLLALLLRRDFSVSYVYGHTNSHLPLAYTISALWAGQEGSLLLWLWFLALLSVIAVWRQQAIARAALTARSVGAARVSTKHAPAIPQTAALPYAVAALTLNQAFLALVLLAASNPFALLPVTPTDGQGLNPLLQNFWMVMHPPVVFLAYAAYTVPFALAFGGVVTGRFTREWLESVRRWALFAWLFLGAGILMGAWWAYLELGWGGYWAWDPVENSSLIPWLTGTALLHSLMMQERRDTFRQWNLWLIGATFLLCLFATFVTRSGAVQSVHAFGLSSLGNYFIGFILLLLAIQVYLLHKRRQQINMPQEVGALLSREASLLLTNLLFVGAAGIVLLGILFPTLARAIQGREISLGAAFYERTVGPLAQIIVLVIGVCPWLPWGGMKSGALWRRLLPATLAALGVVVALLLLGIRYGPALVAFGVAAFVLVSLLASTYREVAVRQRSQRERPMQALARLWQKGYRRYGGRIVHLGVVLIAVGITGSSIYQDEVQVSLTQGEQVDLGGYSVRYRQPFIETSPLYQRVGAEVDILRGESVVTTLKPVKDFFWSADQWVTEVAIHTTLKQDLYVILAGMEDDGKLASFRLLVNPLVVWLWIGGALLLMGGVIAWWPRPGPQVPASEEEDA
ncbi:MAG: heme lyase CcmF/NrfE family subunit [Chloroflexi bacterium]|jgi:cytochrome c-type biogenesis protein CcmF|nr:heme lyase CcmF/NrfE family subunit [Chloroflexota bacterium]